MLTLRVIPLSMQFIIMFSWESPLSCLYYTHWLSTFFNVHVCCRSWCNFFTLFTLFELTLCYFVAFLTCKANAYFFIETPQVIMVIMCIIITLQTTFGVHRNKYVCLFVCAGLCPVQYFLCLDGSIILANISVIEVVSGKGLANLLCLSVFQLVSLFVQWGYFCEFYSQQGGQRMSFIWVVCWGRGCRFACWDIYFLSNDNVFWRDIDSGVYPSIEKI